MATMPRDAATARPQETGHNEGASEGPTADANAIRALLASQFASLRWSTGESANWAGFEAGFLPGAQLFGAARPVAAQTAAGFQARRRRLREEGVLDAFSERMLGTEVRGFGNVAVAMAACEMLENGADVRRDVSAFLLVKDPEGWRIAAQAWDAETDRNPLPDRLRGPRGRADTADS